MGAVQVVEDYWGEVKMGKTRRSRVKANTEITKTKKKQVDRSYD